MNCYCLSQLSKIAIGISIVAIVISIIGITSVNNLSDQQIISKDVDTRVFHISTVHVDGKTNINGDEMHPPEPFSTSTLPEGGGYALTAPDEQGNWKVRAFEFSPSQLVVRQGDQVTLNFLAVQGSHHAISVKGYTDEFELDRGELSTVTFTADQVGMIDYICSLHHPTMQGQIVVLPRE